MEFSEKWLKEWTGSDINTCLLSDQMTQLGLEVEKVTKIKNICTNLIVGKIIKCLRHYSMSKLLLFQVNIGNDKHIQVISREINFILGMNIIIATRSSVLFDYAFIKLIELKRLKYDGIICFCEDIGVINFDNGLIVLPSDLAVGSDVNKYFSLDDNIIKISSTPNRADALSILGIARDIAALNNLPLSCIKKYPRAVNMSEKLDILINIPDVCFRFFGRVIRNINVLQNTPFWMSEKLRRSSVFSSNIINNIINYVLVELGQPLYIIDLNSIVKKIIIRKSLKNETFLNCNNERSIIDDDTIVISDEEKILVLGGHINSCVSNISFSSKSLFLGCAAYNHSDIFKTSLKYGCKNIFTDRYERGIDLNMQFEALEYATDLIVRFCNGESSDITTKIENKKIFNQNLIKLYQKKLYNIIGFVIDSELVTYNLVKLGFKVTIFDQYWLTIPPSWRFDIKIEEDVISELLRIFGYSKVFSAPLTRHTNISYDDEMYTSLKRAKLYLVDQGYHEIITYGFVNPDIQKLLFPNITPLYLSNPISREMSSMRISLWTGLLSSVSYNQNRQENRLRLFESGLCFSYNSREQLGVTQSMYLSGVLSGYRNTLHWDILDKQVDFYDAKGDVESILDLLGKLSEVEFKKCDILGLHPCQSVSIYLKDKIVGFLGVVNSNIEKKLNLKGKAVVFELIWDKITFLKHVKIQKVSEYPRSVRDISIIVDDIVSVGEIITECKKFSFENIVDISLFDIFRSDKIGIRKKSLAFRFLFGNKNKTLTEEEISNILRQCILALKLKFKIILRKDILN
ncbi:phenylalanine--tRNA ligase subunit beta [Buchnera aphidicola]|uniref:Phenylalanine--tRNA ligase beta subunit n=1 Tax=Buchnera aphidicola subsp. Melaphis rhois TaxID=118103 RepID=A0A4D6Y2P4_BUCMH|nr:phenylalanine--tRNA ligase subunit beta [Buchnera aphidicola]QCI23159.1 phenylalanine--tRNA ligase subunit beta [Buchnera aphidicola (Melaphis rhois)]